MDAYDVLNKLVGYINPVGISEDDDERFESQQAVLKWDNRAEQQLLF